MIERPLFKYGSLEAPQLVRLFRRPGIYAPCADDLTQPIELQRFIDAALASPQFFFLGRDARKEAFIFAPNHNQVTFQCHVAVREDCRGGALKRFLEAGKWIYENTHCRSIVGFVREDNAPARALIAQAGGRRVGTLKKSILFNGEYRDEIVYQGTIDEFNDLWGKELGRVER